MSSKISKSWEKTRTEVHSPDGVKELRRAVKYGLTRKYIGIAESMFRYEGLDSPMLEDMQIMSQDTVPEVLLMKNGQCVWFKDPTTDQIHCLPMTMTNAINMYGKPSSWRPVPVGWTDDLAPKMKGTAIERIMNMELDATNSVVMRNDLFGGNDADYIEAMVNELVDNTLTMNQLQLIAKAPFVFNVTEDNMLSAKNFFLAMCNDRPAIFTNAMGERPMPVIESTQMKIDPALFELFDRFECQILEYIGFPCVPITKRAQQTVSEVQSNDAKIYMRRQEKWNQRQKACDRINEMFGTSLRCVSVIDEDMDGSIRDAEGTEYGDDRYDETQEEG